MVFLLIALGSLPHFLTLAFLMIPFIFLNEDEGGDDGDEGDHDDDDDDDDGGGGGGGPPIPKKLSLPFGGDILGMVNDLLDSPLAPIFVILFICCCCCCCSMVLNFGGSGDMITEWLNGVPYIGQSVVAITNIYVPIMRAEIQKSGLGPYLIEKGPTGGAFSEIWTIFQNPWVLEWEEAKEEEINPVYDRGIIIDGLDMIPSQPMSEHSAKLKITVRNTAQDTRANCIKFYVDNVPEVQQKTRLRFAGATNPDINLGTGGNCFYLPCDREDYPEGEAGDEEYADCQENNKGRWYLEDKEFEPGPCCEVCGDVYNEDECNTCLLEFSQEELRDASLPPNIYPGDTVSLVAESITPANRVKDHSEVALHTTDLRIKFKYDFEPLENVFCTDATSTRGKECTYTEGSSLKTDTVFNGLNEKEMSSYTFTILEPGDYTQQQLLDWDSKIVNYIAGGPVKAHVIHRKEDVYYRENSIFIHYKIENIGADSDANELVYLHPESIKIIIPSDFEVVTHRGTATEKGFNFLKCIKYDGELLYASEGSISHPWICTPQVGGECYDILPSGKCSGWIWHSGNVAGRDPNDSLEQDARPWLSTLNFYEGGTIEIPFELGTINADANKEYTISLVFLGAPFGGGQQSQDKCPKEMESKSAFTYELEQTRVVAVQPVMAGTLE